MYGPGNGATAEVEGLGPVRERTFLHGTVGSALRDLEALGIQLAPTVLCSPRAGQAALRLGQERGRDVMALPEGSVSTPGAGVFVPHGAGDATAAAP